MNSLLYRNLSKIQKMLASLDVESLFTNIPVNETIEIIIHEVYNHPDIAPPNMPRESLKNLLYICTTKTPFSSPKGDLYQQIDGVSMGTPLGPTLANFYASYVENKVFDNNPSLKPKVYCRYVDDTFVVINNYHELERLQSEFEENSVLKNTFEIENQKKVPFLDTLITRSSTSVSAEVYIRPTNTGECLNYNSICLEV